MKKIVLLLSFVAVVLGMTACNSSKSDPFWAYFGSLEMGNTFKNVIIAEDGTTLEAETGYASLPSPSGSLNRQFCWAYFSYDEANFSGSGPGKKLPIRLLSDVATFPTRSISSYEESENTGDPICTLYDMTTDNDQLMVVSNFLIFSPIAHYYTVTNNIPDWGFSVEVERELEEGEKNEIINLWLKFTLTNKDGATEKKGPANYTDYHAIDLDYLNGLVDGFKKTDTNGEDMTYILKFNYYAYALKDGSYDQNTIEEKSIEIEWTPNKDPYNKVHQ